MTTDSRKVESAVSAEAVTNERLDGWADESSGFVALHQKQVLIPVEGEGGVIFPPTYADIGYNIDTLSDGTRVAMIDSVGSQANRLEPVFKVAPGVSRDAWLVPQIEIVLRIEACGKCPACRSDKKGAKCGSPHKEKSSLLDLAHRSADAVVQSSTLASDIALAFEALRKTGDAGPLCTLAPTSLVFGVWDSRGRTGEKRPRLVRAIIRAWNVEPLHTAAQFNSVWKALDQAQQAELQKEAKRQKMKLSQKGFADAPAVFRPKLKIPEHVDGRPNPEARLLGGIVARGPIERDVTVNLVALRGLYGKDDGATKQIRQYLLGLSLFAATTEIALFLREGCHLRYGDADVWHAVPRRGEPKEVNLGCAAAREVIRKYAMGQAAHFRQQWPDILEYTFDIKEAKKLLLKKDDESPDGE